MEHSVIEPSDPADPPAPAPPLDDTRSRERRDRMLVAAFIACVSVIGAIGVGCIFKAPQEWQLAKDALTTAKDLATALLTGYFALQVGGRK